MTFLLPLGLLALLTLPIIALLHLIRQRRERVRVPSLQIWRDLQRTTVQQKPRRLPLTMMLLLHLLLAALLAIALGQPLFELARTQATHIGIVIDTSTSMAATDEQGDRLNAARVEARRVIEGLGRADSVALIELSAEPRILAQGEGNDIALVTQQLNRLQAGGPDGDLASAVSIAQATAKPQAALRVIVLADRSLRAAAPLSIAGEVEWRAFGEAGDNTAIVAFAARPLRNGQQQLYARVANLGATPIARTLQLNLDGERAATEPMRLAPGAEAEWSWPLPRGTTRAEALLTGNDIQPLDDRAAVVVGGNVQTRVALVSAEATPLERALRAQRDISVQLVSPAEYRADTDADLVVFNNFIPSALPEAPTLIVAPPADNRLLPVTAEIAPKERAQAGDARFAAIDFGPVQFDRVAEITPPAWADVAVESGGVPLVLTGQLNNQPMAIWTFDLLESNLANRLAFPLLTAATTRTLLPQPNDRLLVGAPAPFALRASDGTVVAAGDRLYAPGIYEAESGTGAIAVNALDAEESSLQERTAPTIATVARSVAGSDEPVGRELWKPLLIAGLLVLLVEWIYANRANLRRRRATA